ncbi:MAG: hypothetical protein ISS69_10165 [Phycisphaerae bacterium]|nr:hypothetical protein [Planctomycetota bacterium]MBL7220467.1 hypothetical protein [Phycisphaerae bacterium]
MGENQVGVSSIWRTIIPAFIAGVVLAFFLIVGVPENKAEPYVGLVVAITAVTFCAAFWISRVLQGAVQQFEGVFRTIGISLVLGIATVNLLVLLIYRIYLHRFSSEGWIIAFLLLGNAVVFLLILGLPWYARFAGGLSREDRQQKAEVILLTDRLEEAELAFMGVMNRSGESMTVHDRPKITILREKVRGMSPFDQANTASADVDAELLEYVRQIESSVQDVAAIPLDDLSEWSDHVAELCDKAMALIRRREKLLLA